MHYNIPKDITSYIKIYDISFEDTFLSRLIDKYDSHLTIATVGNGRIDKHARNCLTHAIEDGELQSIIYNAIDYVIKSYTSEFPQVSISQNAGGYFFLKYYSEGYYRQHVDTFTIQPKRTLSIILLLNDDFEGGDILFFNQTHRVHLQKNQILVFPSCFLFPHEVETITKGIRYSIVTWVY